MPLSCDLCGKSAIPDGDIVQFDHKNICPACKDGFFQRLREGVLPQTPGMVRRVAVLALHLAWTVFSAYLILLAVHLLVILGVKQFGTPRSENLQVAGGFAWFLLIFVLDPAVSAAAAVLTVRFAARQLAIAPKDALKSLAPPLLIILVATGVPAALVCGILVFAMFIGFLLALLLSPYFLTILFALAYLLWLKWRAR